MLFLQYIIINLVLTKSSGPKRHADSLTAPIFAGLRLSPHTPTATQPPHLDVGENVAAVRDGIHCLTNFSGFGLF